MHLHTNYRRLSQCAGFLRENCQDKVIVLADILAADKSDVPSDAPSSVPQPPWLI